MPLATGLFHRVMTMSGQQLTATTPQHATSTAQAVLEALDLTPTTLETIRDPKKTSMERLISAVRVGHYPTMLWNAPPRVENDPRGEECKLIAQARYIQPGT